MQTLNERPNPFLSIIVPMHNAITKMDSAIRTLQGINEQWSIDYGAAAQKVSYEVIFIDDSSDDGTYERLQELVEYQENWSLLRTPENSGSPSLPRNMGIESATGEYVLFLDGDDEINPKGVYEACRLAIEQKLDTVRSPVEIFYSVDGRRVLNGVLNFNAHAPKLDKIASIARWQSLICTALWRKSVLVENGLKFDVESRMGEDVAFTAAGLFASKTIGYVNTPLFHYVRHGGDGSSAMHNFDGKKIRELVTSWQKLEDIFEAHGMSYIKLHGASTIGYALKLIIKHHVISEIDADDIEYFEEYFSRNAKTIGSIEFADPHVADWVAKLIGPQPGNFSETVKPRLLIAGHDLKFIKPAIPYLREFYNIRVDEWASEITHDEEQGTRLVKWADFVWVEWLTAASVWYSERVRPTQELVIRAHRYELGRNYGTSVKDERVSAYISIAPHCHEDLIERFGIRRNRLRFIPNYYFVDSYAHADETDEERAYRLALVGYVPKRKGYMKALEALAKLREQDSRYTLTLFGKSWEEMPWVRGDANERAYFTACDNFIEQHDLKDAVQVIGWANIREVIRDYGFVLSTSEHEGSHVGPGEAFCAGNVGVFLPWRGAEYVYPRDAVASSVDEMVEKIAALSKSEDLNTAGREGREFMKSNYDISLFVDRVVKLFRSFA